MRWIAAAILALIVTVPGYAVVAPAGGDGAQEELALLQAAAGRLEANDSAGALPLLKQAVASPAFAELTPRQRYIAYRLLAGAALLTDDNQTAATASRQATQSSYAEWYDWYERVWASSGIGDKKDAILSLTVLAEKWPDRVSEFKLQTIYRVVDEASDAEGGEALQAKLLRVLSQAHWSPKDEPADRADGLWLRLARTELKSGNTSEATKLAELITNPGDIVTMHADKAFDAIIAANPKRYDISAAFAGALAREKTWMAASPDLLEPMIDAATTLYLLDRQAEALTLLDGAVAQVRSGKEFKDKEDELNWLYDRRADVLFAQGRVDDALAEMEVGSRTGEGSNTSPNVSQTINLADMYYSLGRPSDALAALARLGDAKASPYGYMAAEEVRACAYAQLGDKEKLAQSLKFISEHVKDAPAVALQGQICAGDVDGAAALAVKLLGDEKTREAVLNRLHKHRDARLAPHGAFQAKLDAAWKALRERPEVIKAVEQFGHILDLPVLSF